MLKSLEKFVLFVFIVSAIFGLVVAGVALTDRMHEAYVWNGGTCRICHHEYEFMGEAHGEECPFVYKCELCGHSVALGHRR